MDAEIVIFRTVAEENSYTPLRHLVLCNTPLGVHYPAGKLLEFYCYRATERATRPKGIFLTLDITKGYHIPTNMLHCEMLLYIADRYYRQQYIFGNTVHHRDSACLSRAAYWLSYSKLVLFENHFEFSKLHFQIPCLTCQPITSVQLNTVTLLRITELWDAQNRDMNKYLIFLRVSVNSTCGPLIHGFSIVAFADYCPTALISEKYNLTLLQTFDVSNTYNRTRSFDLVLFSVGFDMGSLSFVYELNFVSVNFVTLTSLPSPASDVATFVSPLDTPTWIFALASVFMVAAYLMWLSWKESHRSGWILLIAIIADKVFTVATILLAQVGESAGKAYRVRKVGLVIVTLWFSGNFLLMANLYQGSIYSCLAVFFPPKTPSGVMDLVNWDVPIVEVATIYDPETGSGNMSFLSYIIPQLISYHRDQNIKLTQFLTKFQSRLLSRNNQFVRNMVEGTIVNKNKKITQSIVLMYFEHLIETYIKLIRLLGNQFVVQNKGDSPFNGVLGKIGIQNLLSPYFVRELRRMHESGLRVMWENVLKAHTLLSFKANLYEHHKYFEAVQDSFGSMRKPVTFHESNPVSMDLILPVFSLCGILIAFGLVGFVAENSKAVKNRVRFITKELIYVKKGISIIIEAKCSHTGALYVIGSFYFPPTREGELTLMDHLITLEEIIEKHPKHHHILGGDFNARISSLGSLINLHSPCPQLRKSQDQISTPRGETVINFMTDNDLGKSVIDLVFCSPTIEAVTHSCGTLSVPISHHHPYKLTWQGSSHQYQLPIPHIIKFSRKSDKYQAFQETLHTHCTALLASRSIAYPTLVNTITDVALSTGLARFYDSLSHIPHKPWYDKECHVSNRSHSYKALLRDKKRKHSSRLKQQLNNALRQQDFWQAIKPFRSTPFVPNLITNEKWIEFYDTLMPPPPTHKESFIGVTHPDLDIPITMQELQLALSSLPVGKAPGIDGIHNELLKVLPTDALLVLLECFNEIFASEQTPEEWGLSITVMLHKKGDKLNPNNYRPIALLNSLLKLFTHIICHRLTKWANECHILPESQCGFRAGRGCDDQIFTLTSAITIGTRGKRASVFGLFIDFARAFPSIPHDKLWNKLHTIGVSGKIIRLLQSLYSNASTKIRLQDAYSSPIAITTGLLQGEILSPLLFSLYTCDIEEILSNLDVSGVKISPSLTIHLLMYADDTIVLSSTCDGLRMKIRALQKYFAQLSLNVHLAKAKVIVFRRNGGRLPKGTTFTYNGEPIEIVNQYTYLGVPFSSSGVFCKAAKHFKQKGLAALGATWSILTRSRFEGMQKKFNLFSALVTSTALYGAHLWGLRYLEEIEKTQYQFHRQLNRPPLSIRVAHQTLRYLRKVMQHEEDRYTSQCLSTLQILVAEEPDDDMNWLNQIKSWIGLDWITMTQAALEADVTRTSLSQRFSYYSRLLAEPPSQAPYVNLPIPLPALRIIAQCRLGQGRYSTPLGMIKLNYDEECDICNQHALNSLSHILLHCPLHMQARLQTGSSPSLKIYHNMPKQNNGDFICLSLTQCFSVSSPPLSQTVNTHRLYTTVYSSMETKRYPAIFCIQIWRESDSRGSECEKFYGGPTPTQPVPPQAIAATTTPQVPNAEQLQAQIRRLKRPRHEDDLPETSTLCQPPQFNMSFSTTAQVLGPRPFRLAPPDPPRPFSISSPNPFRC
ncbi:putative RNA-directed DNA polymerase from transposon BS [Folsomia candida]|uniref:Putative RNA-directed DNA polymerase from transposon BS n=1 Tax=Folsomia candida TaxID=158441 RepID=A0A226D5A6_FOLCA|nr:putative RNA-directed DNA polymerase from transposon BS [Folsomia candida]